jgi:mono/diheme cytochrome c family protein
MGGMQGMRGMMHEMMRGVVPAGVTPEALPEPAGRGARLLVAYCAQCHALPSPRMHTAEEWPPVVARMIGRMRMMEGMGPMMMMMENVRAPSAEEESALLEYLRAHALRPAGRDALESGIPGAVTFARVCSACHAPPDPALYGPDAWPAVVGRMQAIHREMGRAPIAGGEVEEIVEFLRRASQRARPGR